jgi:hypothetical protein
MTPDATNYERDERMAIAEADRAGREDTEARRIEAEQAAGLERIRVLAARNRRDAWLKKRFKKSE